MKAPRAKVRRGRAVYGNLARGCQMEILAKTDHIGFMDKQS